MKKYFSKETNDFYKGEQIAKEVMGLLDKESKHTDNQLLDDYVINDPNAKKLFELLTDSKKVSDIVSDFKRDEKFEGANALKRRLDAIDRKRKIRLITYTTGISVACVMIALSFMIFVSTPQKETKRVAIHSGISTPTLILNNGDTISLAGKNEKNLIGEDYSIKKVDKINKEYNNTQDTLIFNKIIIPSKYTYSIVLSDGSEVFLNANSEFKYPVTFNKEKREVFLSGEAFFKVAKNKIPFVVTTTDISVKVYGTEFNVNTNISGDIETVLLSGSVGVKVNNDESNEIMIKPNEMFTLYRNSGKVKIKNVIASDYVSWVDGYFNCTKTSLKTFINQISQWYGVDFEFEKAEIAEISVSVLHLNRNLDFIDILSVIENMADVEIVKRKGGDYLIK